MHYHYYPLGYKPEYATMSEHYLQYAEVYKDTIHLLLEEYLEHPPMHDYSLAPVLFLLRQYIELQLKGIIMYHEQTHKVVHGHDIIWLYKKAIKIIEERYGLNEIGSPHEDVEKFIYRLGNFDKGGQAFRYPERKDGKEFFDDSIRIDDWLHDKIISLPSLVDIAKKIIDTFEGIEGYLDIKKENEEEELANAEHF